jgi:hypothetical protein
MVSYFKKFGMGRVLAVCLTVSVCGLVCTLWVTFPPSGRFQNDDVSFEGISFFEFRSGRVRLVLSGSVTQECGFYMKTNGNWFWITQNGVTNVLEPTVLGIRVRDDERHWLKSYPRVFK